MKHKTILAGICFAALQLSGCQAFNNAKSGEPSPWNFDAYQLNGPGQVFTDAGKTHVLMPGGGKAVQVNASGNPKWTQAGAVIEIEGRPERIEIITETNEKLEANLKEPFKIETKPDFVQEQAKTQPPEPDSDSKNTQHNQKG